MIISKLLPQLPQLCNHSCVTTVITNPGSPAIVDQQRCGHVERRQGSAEVLHHIHHHGRHHLVGAGVNLLFLPQYHRHRACQSNTIKSSQSNKISQILIRERIIDTAPASQIQSNQVSETQYKDRQPVTSSQSNSTRMCVCVCVCVCVSVCVCGGVDSVGGVYLLDRAVWLYRSL